MTFDITRHNDPKYQPPEPWDEWDPFGGCWSCNWCGAAAGFQVHHMNCKRVTPQPSEGTEKKP